MHISDEKTMISSAEERGIKKGLQQGSQQKAIEAALILINDFKVSPEEAATKMNAPLEKVLASLSGQDNPC